MSAVSFTFFLVILNTIASSEVLIDKDTVTPMWNSSLTSDIDISGQTTAEDDHGVSNVDPHFKMVDFVPDAVLNLTIAEDPWHTFTIQFDEEKFLLWLKCLSDEYTTSCELLTRHIFGSDYVHSAGTTTSATSVSSTDYIYTCWLLDQRFIQEHGEINCTRSNHTCTEATDPCSVTIGGTSVIFQWSVKQRIELAHDSQRVGIVCGDICEQKKDEETGSVTLKWNYVWIIVGVVGGVLLISIIIIIVLLCQTWRHKKKKTGSKTLDDHHGEEKRNSRYTGEEDPSDELRLGDNGAVSAVGFVELTELGTPRNSAVIRDQPEKGVEHLTNASVDRNRETESNKAHDATDARGSMYVRKGQKM